MAIKNILIPVIKKAQNFVANVVRDIVKRYDVDAIHMDDYFYPYRIPGKEFPDEAAYKKSGTNLVKMTGAEAILIQSLRLLVEQLNREKRLPLWNITI